MFKKALLGVIISIFLIGCGGGSSSGGSGSSSTTFTVERGAIVNATVKDDNGQVAKQIPNTNQYVFDDKVKYPVSVSGGFIDIDGNGIKNTDDIDLDMILSTYSGNTITLISTIIGSKRDENLENLKKVFSINSSDLLLLPSDNKKVALLTNLIYKELELNPNISSSQIIDKIKNNDVDILNKYTAVNLDDYINLTPKEFLEESEKETIREIKSKKILSENLPIYKGGDLSSKTIINQKSTYISAQCYTKTEDSKGRIHNPCYSCHINSEVPNYINDEDLQESYDFSNNSKTNPFTNLFKDRSSEISAISDEDILTYIDENNYLNKDGKIILANRLKYAFPEEWDFPYDGSKDGKWNGFIPDCYFNFDDEGFDKDKNGNYTGWRAFAYSPFLGTFWPTNGSTDDVMIRLSPSLMQDKDGRFSKEVYKINLAIVESMIKKEDIDLGFEVDENDYGVDLNHNDTMDKTSTIVFKWNKPDSITNYPKVIYKNYYVGLAKEKLVTNELHISPGLYPDGTEFLHSVRYVGVTKDKSSIKMSNRMKELRYAKKTTWNNYSQLSNAALSEIKEKDDFPDRLKTITGNIEDGLQTGLGWVYQGFIEDAQGDLRPQTYEETVSCIGCHSGIGAITDSTFAFPRKENSYNNGWYHWSQKDLTGIKDRVLSNGKGEYAYYLEQNNAGDEFRGNQEVKSKFFDNNGILIQSEVDKIADDITYLILPSVQRAIQLNKAYKVIVDEQSYIYGKSGHVGPLDDTVYKEITIGKSTGITAIKH
ncbi:MAG: hypothetical protein ACNI25_11930 [Halarcobacter sp.]